MIISKKLGRVIAKFRILVYTLGIEFVDADYKYNLRTLNVAFFIGVYLGCTAYTLVTVDTEEKWRCLASAGMGAQGCIKFRMAILCHQQAHDEMHKIIVLYSKIQKKGQSSDEYKILATCVSVCNKVLNLYMLIFACGLVMLLSYPVIVYFVFDQKVFMVTMNIPGVDPYGQWGFVLHYVLHSAMAVIACVGSPAGDFYFMFCVAHIYVFGEFLRFHIKTFNNWLLDPATDVCDKDKVAEQINEILLEHQNLLKFMDHVDELYFLPIGVHIGTATVSLGIALFLLVTSTWYIAVMYVLIALFQLFVYSMLGTIVEIKNDHLIEYVSDILWYLIPLAEQRKVKLLLAKCQNPKEYTIAGYAPLNFATCVAILKSIYSFFMMLLNTL